MLAVIPAGGRAERFGGLYKELLPIGGPGDVLLSRAFRQAGQLGATRYVLISSPEKAAAHAAFIERHASDLDLTILLRREQDDVWDAIRRTLHFREDSVLVLPDTVFTTVVGRPRFSNLTFGVFRALEPARFSVVVDNHIHTKRIDVRAPAWAWGYVAWSARVAEYWLDYETDNGPFTHYDRAFEQAMRRFGYTRELITRYEDLGQWDTYQRFLREWRAEW